MAARDLEEKRSMFPSANLAAMQLPLKILTTDLYRIHKTINHPIYFGDSGNYRYDSPDLKAANFKTFYAGEDKYSAFIEVFGDCGGKLVSQSGLESRSISVVKLNTAKLVDITGPNAAKIGAAGETSAGPYRISQQWAKALWDHPDLPDGIYYHARHDLTRFSIALFDRASTLVSVAQTICLADPKYAYDLAEMLNKYEFGLSF